jgi:hypothetical protein
MKDDNRPTKTIAIVVLIVVAVAAAVWSGVKSFAPPSGRQVGTLGDITPKSPPSNPVSGTSTTPEANGEGGGAPPGADPASRSGGK